VHSSLEVVCRFRLRRLSVERFGGLVGQRAVRVVSSNFDYDTCT
jgi:hypothetical protein